MLRCRPWNTWRSRYLCTRCRHDKNLGANLPIHTRGYSNNSQASGRPLGSLPNKDNGGSTQQRGSGLSSWGGLSAGRPKPAGLDPIGRLNQSNDSFANAEELSKNRRAGEVDNLEDLLPHERAARLRVASRPASNDSPLQGIGRLHRQPPHHRASTRSPLGEVLGRTGQSQPRGGSRLRLGGDAGHGTRGLPNIPSLKPRNDAARAPFSPRPSPAARNASPRDRGASNQQSPRETTARDRGNDDPFLSAFASVREEEDTGKKTKKAKKPKANLSGLEEWGLLTKKQGPASRKPNTSSKPAARNSGDSFWGRFKQVVNDESSPRAAGKQGGEESQRWDSMKLGLEDKEPRRSRARPWDDVEFRLQPEDDTMVSRRPRERHASMLDESYQIDHSRRTKGKSVYRDEGKKSKKRGHGSARNSRRRDEDDDDEEWDEEAERRAEERRARKAERKLQRQLDAEELRGGSKPTVLRLPEFINVTNLAAALKMRADALLSTLEDIGFQNMSEDGKPIQMTDDSIFDGATAALIAQEFGLEAEVDKGGERDLVPRPPADDPSALPQRPPVVTIMGHVDHGKTTLLDWLRKSSVAAQEHGGITQHIGAFMVKMSSGSLMTFLDTPGHAAFMSMRRRGAMVTDIVVLVVAADDSVKPQTLEALKLVRADNVPVIVAITKMDKEDARPDQVKADLARHNVEIEDYGGDVQVVCVSGKTGQGMEDLEESIATLSEILDVRAEKDGMAEGSVLEASVKQDGKSATVLVKRGTLRQGDTIVAGHTWARARLLRNEAGVELSEAPPGTPVEVLGWRDELPTAGDGFLQAPDEDKARTAVKYREEMRYREVSAMQLVEQEKRERERIVAEKAAEQAALAGVDPAATASNEPSGPTIVNFIVRGDVVGSVEAVEATISGIGNHEVAARILRSAAGQVSEFDVEHAAASGSTIVNFNNSIPAHVKRLAEEKDVRLLDHTVIYHLVDEVKQTLSDQLSDVISYKVVGEAEIIQIFPINVKGRKYMNIAGCKIRNGLLNVNSSVRILRRGEKVFDGKIDALKHGKKDVSEMRKGTECGISFEGFQGFNVGDQIQSYEEVREKRSL